jgi:hypothetical protein
MKTIIFSDCHGRPDLITNVLEHTKSWDRAIFSGDILDIGFHPLECMDALLENDIELLWGNHDLAPKLSQRISPITAYDNEVYEKLNSITSKFSISTWQDDILISHAGLSQFFYDNYFNEDITTVKEISDYLNSMSLKEMWGDQTPLWFRPTKWYAPKAGLKQVVGHTPPSWLAYVGTEYPNYHTVDPYCKVGFGPDRYRYAVIEDGVITVIDSNGRY